MRRSLPVRAGEPADHFRQLDRREAVEFAAADELGYLQSCPVEDARQQPRLALLAVRAGVIKRLQGAFDDRDFLALPCFDLAFDLGQPVLQLLLLFIQGAQPSGLFAVLLQPFAALAGRAPYLHIEAGGFIYQP